MSLACLTLPLPRKTVNSLLTIVSMVASYGSLEVLLITMVIVSFQLRTFIEFFVGDACDALNSWLIYFKAELGDPVCFDVVGSLHIGTLIFFCIPLCHGQSKGSFVHY